MKFVHVVDKCLKCFFTIRAMEFFPNIPHKSFKLTNILAKCFPLSIMFLDILYNVIALSNFAERIPLIFLHFLYLKNCIKTYILIFQFFVYIPEWISQFISLGIIFLHDFLKSFQHTPLLSKVTPHFLFWKLYFFNLNNGKDSIFLIFIRNACGNLIFDSLNILIFRVVIIFQFFVENTYHPLHYHFFNEKLVPEPMMPLRVFFIIDPINHFCS